MLIKKLTKQMEYDNTYQCKAGVVCLQGKLCDPHLSALEVRFSRRGAIQIYWMAK